MTRALVLSGGGPVGIGWEAGLLVGLAESGVDTGTADAVVGTSAGSVVGFTAASKGDLTEAVSLVRGSPTGTAPSAPLPPAAPAAAQAQIDQLMTGLAEAAIHPEAAERVRQEMGRMALQADTISEGDWLGLFSTFAGAEWPAGFSCTAVSTSTGSFRVWDGEAGVDPQLAIASSCAVPGVFPPVTIDGDRWMDGGGRDLLNADVATGHDIVLAVSCIMLELPEGLSLPPFDAVLAATRSQLDRLRAGGSSVEVVVPGPAMLEISGWGANLMDFDRAADAYHAGLEQGRSEAARITAHWR